MTIFYHDTNFNGKYGLHYKMGGEHVYYCDRGKDCTRKQAECVICNFIFCTNVLEEHFRDEHDIDAVDMNSLIINVLFDGIRFWATD